ncbi:MAG: TerB family tellurite resistance protein [Leptolyngbyaceae cyanobacterium MO_188.B28]|nr:TerB family tellurite resistance protein [Leptolyngbyaceae cyanobacterium MO_188.B28]
MGLQPPPPPSISPRQMNLIRIVASMAWCDANLAEEEAELMLDRFSHLFSAAPDRQKELRQELQDYLMQNIPLEELTPKLTTQVEKELVLRLGYEVISSSARTPDEDLINPEEAETYRRLVELLDLPADVLQRVEAEAKAELEGNVDIIEMLTSQLREFMQM